MNRLLSSFIGSSHSPVHLLTKDPLLGYNHKAVVILGFAGSKHKYLDKYSAFYNEMGFRTSQLEVNFNLFKTESQINKTISQIISHLPKDPSQQTSVLFHVLSNGGFEYYTRLFNEIYKDRSSYNIIGTVFDSAPSLDLTPDIISRAITAAWNPLIATAGAFLLRVFFCLFYLKSVRTSYAESKFHFQELMREHYKSYPMLFLYSKEDSITASDYLEDYIETLKKQHNGVTTHRFQNTGHVQHLQQKPEEYKNSIKLFLQQNNTQTQEIPPSILPPL